MDLELLDTLEERVDQAVAAVQDLRAENEVLRQETQELEHKVEGLTRDVAGSHAARDEVARLAARCEELESKLEGVRGRIEKMVERMRHLEA
jgi:predicted RNase H-like nuclease (RuvC/YqgF family)